MVNKSKSAFRTIAEVGREIGVATHVLRFWETKFKEISPMKTSGGRRYYRPDDVELIRLIKEFLYEKRYTIEGVQKIFKEYGIKAFLNGDIQKDFFEPVLAQGDSPVTSSPSSAVSKLDDIQIEKLTKLKNELLDLKNNLQNFLVG